MDKIKKIAQGKSFINLIERNRIYVDKTKEIFSLLSNDRVFLSRPRRFGKSTILDTIGTLFESGVEPYFKGTWIYDKWEDTTYPILRISFIDYSFTNIELFKIEFCKTISDFAKEYDLVNFNENILTEPSLFLGELFRVLRLAKKNVVILIDEYDSQLTANINNPQLYNAFKILLREIYATLKDKNEIRFLGITGVTRLKDVTIFSVGSDILDVTYDNDVATITGFTREEIAKYYIDYLNLGVSLEKNKKVEEVTNEEREELLNRIALEYNGYSFDSFNEKTVFSTFSVNQFFASLLKFKKVIFGDFWYANGGLPSILANYLQNHRIDILEYQDKTVTVSSNEFLNPTSLLDMNQRVLMAQTGYLTLKDEISPSCDDIFLEIPNYEVNRALIKASFLQNFGIKINLNSTDKKMLASGSSDDIKKVFAAIINAIPYDTHPIPNEDYIQKMFMMYFLGAGLLYQDEKHTRKGRSDIIIEFPFRRIVVEFKYAHNDNEAKKLLAYALEQIKIKDYGNFPPVKELLRFALVYDAEKKEIGYMEQEGK